jgi:RecB family endonuclease NucS
VQRAKDELDRRKAEEQGKAQLQRFDHELKQRTESRRTEDARGEIRSPEPPAPLQ